MWKKVLAALALFCAAAAAMAAIDINQATEADLDGVKGIGPVTSKLILAERKKGKFKDWQDLIARVKGVGETRAAKFSDEGLTVNGQAFKPAAAAGQNGKAGAKDEKAARKQARAEPAKPAASGAKK